MALRSTYPDIHVPENLSYPQFILEHFESYGDKTAIIDGRSGLSYTYKQLKELVIQFANGLKDLEGITKKDTCAIYCPNMLEYPILLYGITLAGCLATTINPLYTEYELEHQLLDTQSKFIVTTPALEEKAKKVADKIGIRHVIIAGGAATTPGCTSFKDVLNSSNSFDFFTDTIPSQNDPCLIMYSSGTTGLPKGVLMTHYNLIANFFQFSTPPFFCTEVDDVCLGLMPFFHVYGAVVILGGTLRQGATVVSLPRFEPEAMLQTLQNYKVTKASLVPPLILFLAKDPRVQEYDIQHFTDITSGAAPLDRKLSDLFMERLPNIRIIRQGFGMSELCPMSHVNPTSKCINGSVGVLLPNTEAKIVDVVSGEILTADKDGELCVRGPQVMKGYLNNPEATAGTIDTEGWLHTGDIGHYDPEGYFYIVDRLKELIKYKGYQVAPAELEAILISHQRISDAAVIGIPDEEAGELPKAFIVSSGEISIDEVHEYLQSLVAPYKKLRGGVEFVEKIPKSVSGKILRRKLKE